MDGYIFGTSDGSGSSSSRSYGSWLYDTRRMISAPGGGVGSIRRNSSECCPASRCLLKPHQSSRASRIRPDTRSGNRHGTSRSTKMLMCRRLSSSRSSSSTTASSSSSPGCDHQSICGGNSTSFRRARIRICDLLRMAFGEPTRRRKRRTRKREEEYELITAPQHTKRREEEDEEVKQQQQELEGEDVGRRKQEESQQETTTQHSEKEEDELPSLKQQHHHHDYHQLTWKEPSSSQICTQCGGRTGQKKIIPVALYLLSKKYWGGEVIRRAQIILKRRQGIKWLSAVCRDSSNWLEGVLGTEESRKMVNVAAYVDEADYRISLWGLPADGLIMALPEMRTALLLSTFVILVFIGVVIVLYNAVVLFIQLALIPLLAFNNHHSRTLQ